MSYTVRGLDPMYTLDREALLAAKMCAYVCVDLCVSVYVYTNIFFCIHSFIWNVLQESSLRGPPSCVEPRPSRRPPQWHPPHESLGLWVSGCVRMFLA